LCNARSLFAIKDALQKKKKSNNNQVLGRNVRVVEGSHPLQSRRKLPKQSERQATTETHRQPHVISVLHPKLAAHGNVSGASSQRAHSTGAYSAPDAQQLGGVQLAMHDVKGAEGTCSALRTP
jgi:hypothetical protein